MRVLIADDHGIMREGLRCLIEKQPDWEVVGEAEDGQKAVQLAGELLPDIVIMDVAMPNLNGIEATRQIADKLPSVKVLALSIHSSRRFVVDMLKAGVSGYMLKACLFDDLVHAIETVMTGEIYLSPRIASIVVDDYVNGMSPEDVSISSILTDREREVIQLLTEGKSTKQIAMQMHLSAKTIDANRRQVMNKLNIHNVAKLTKYAIRNGLTSLEF
jgi:DNA-binding NarL/FixJ family response regulator